MATYYYDLDSDGSVSTEQADAADDAAAARQALLLISEILRDRALSQTGEVSLTLTVRDEAGRRLWTGRARGGLGPAAGGAS